MQIKPRNLRRDLSYFYIGLIISFAFSGILMNHREDWHPEKYIVNIKQIDVKIPTDVTIDDAYIEKLSSQLKIDDKMR